jgi:hypothetical protein
VTAVYSFFFIFWPARDLTFLWDDWFHLARCATLGRPGVWFQPTTQHWNPLGLAFFDLEYILFGNTYTAYLLVNWLIHVLNVYLVARVLRSRTGDECAAALAALAFGLTTMCRPLIWWATAGPMLGCFTLVALAFLSLQEYAARGGGWLTLATAAAFASVFTWGGGLASGSALVLTAWVVTPRERRARATGGMLAVVAIYSLLYAAFVAGTLGEKLPREASQLRAVAFFPIQAVGLGLVKQVLLLPAGTSPAWAKLLTELYLLAVCVLGYVMKRARLHLVLAHVFLVTFLAPIALTRWQFVEHARPNAGSFQYQYFLALTWTTVLAFAFAALPPRRLVLLATLVPLAYLGVGHARAAREDRTYFSPAVRRELEEPLLVERLAAMTHAARGPIYDAHVPRHLAWWPARVSELMAVVAPTASTTWTLECTDASFAPYEQDEILRRWIKRDGGR